MLLDVPVLLPASVLPSTPRSCPATLCLPPSCCLDLGFPLRTPLLIARRYQQRPRRRHK